MGEEKRYTDEVAEIEDMCGNVEDWWFSWVALATNNQLLVYYLFDYMLHEGRGQVYAVHCHIFNAKPRAKIMEGVLHLMN